MTRLQKKCLVGVAGTHLLVIVALLCSGFISSSSKVDDAQVLTAIPSSVLDHVLNSGVQSPQTPPPAPAPPTPPTPPAPAPPTPPVATPTPPTPPQITRPVEPVRPVEPIPDRTEFTPTPPKPPKSTPPKIQVDLTPVVRKTADTMDQAAEAARAAARAEKRAEAKRLKAIQEAEHTILQNSSSSTEVAVPEGNSGAAMANYASVVKTVYTQAWTPPDDASDDANVKVKVVIANDGHVVSARIIEPSGEASLNESVQKTLDRVTNLEPFPEGVTDKERTYIINFNLKAKRLIG